MEQNDLDCDLDRDLDRILENAPIYTGHSMFIITKSITFVFIVQSLFDDKEIAIHPLSGLKLPRSQSRSSVYTGHFSIMIAI